MDRRHPLFSNFHNNPTDQQPQPLSQFRPGIGRRQFAGDAAYEEMLYSKYYDTPGHARSFLSARAATQDSPLASLMNASSTSAPGESTPSLMSQEQEAQQAPPARSAASLLSLMRDYNDYQQQSQQQAYYTPPGIASSGYGRFGNGSESFFSSGGFSGGGYFNNAYGPPRDQNIPRGASDAIGGREEGPVDLIGMILKARKAEEERTVSFFNNRQPISSALPPNRVPYGMPPSSSMTNQQLGGGTAHNQIPQMMRLTQEGEFQRINTDFRNGLRLKKLLSVPEDKELWIETKTGQNATSDEEDGGGKTYYYSPITFRTTFHRPPTAQCHIVHQLHVQKLLDTTTPTTMIVKRINHQLTEEAMRAYFEQFGKVAFAIVCRYRDVIKPNAKKGYSRNLAYFRMESVAAQNKILQQNLHNIGGQEVEVRIPANRVFVARLPESVSPEELLEYLSQEIWTIDEAAYVIDVYFPLPYRQFAFVTCGGQRIAEKLALKADFMFKGRQSISIASLHREENELADKLFNDKVQFLAGRNELARVRSLQNISTEVKFMLQQLIMSNKPINPMTLLCEINTEFLKNTEEKIRNYLYVQEHVLDIFKNLTTLNESYGGEDGGGLRKRKRLANDDENEPLRNDEEDEVDEEVEGRTTQNTSNKDDEDFVAGEAMSSNSQVTSTIHPLAEMPRD